MTARAAWIVFDLGFGDAGKGATVDYLVREHQAELVVRHHGGAQAGHNVVTPDGRHHTFSQFGAGMFVAGTRTLLGPKFVLHPGAMLVEARRLAQVGASDVLARTSVDGRALVVTPFQQAAGRLRELDRGEAAHGTCGVGVGETVGDSLQHPEDAIRAADLSFPERLHARLISQQTRKLREWNPTRPRLGADSRAAPEFALLGDGRAVERTVELWRTLADQLTIHDAGQTKQRLQDARTIVFEGAQGVLLDQDHGFHPHTTWSDCTPRGALELMADVPARMIRLGVVRSYMVRHGSGPFPTEDTSLADGMLEPHNDDGGWQGCFRRGPLDLVLLRYALHACGGADLLAVSCLDHVGDEAVICDGYLVDRQVVERLESPAPVDLDQLEKLGRWLRRVQPRLHRVPRDQLVGTIERQLGVRVGLIAAGPTATDRHVRQFELPRGFPGEP